MSCEFENIRIRRRENALHGYCLLDEGLSDDDCILFRDSNDFDLFEEADNFYLKDYYHSGLGDIFEEIEEKSDEIQNKRVKENLSVLMSKLNKNLKSYSKHSFSYNYLDNPLIPLSIDINEDDTVFLEWIFNDFRIGFNVSDEADKSTWFLVTNDKSFKDIQTRQGSLSGNKMDTALNTLIKFALENC